MTIVVLRLFVLLLSAASAGTSALAATSCQSLAALDLPQARITFVREVPTGALLGPGNAPIQNVPAFCRVAGVSRPSKDSAIRFEVWLPQSGWNGRFRAVGNGGFAGSINYGDMAAALRDGYATASTDTGHSADGIDAGWALGHPEKIADFGYRAIHETALNAKTVIQAFYGEAPKYSFFASCSNGGRQALMEAQRFPADYDGILAGAPANSWTSLISVNFFNSGVPMLKDPAKYLPAAKIPAISAAVLAACDAQDGLKDGILNDPTHCHFDPAVLLCKGKETDTCLTAPQITELKATYEGARDSEGRQIYPGYEPGGEDGPAGWPLWINSPAPGGHSLGMAFSFGFFRNIVFNDPAWDPASTNLESALQSASKMAPVLNATDPDLKAFQARGGKLILYHGWSDAAIPPLNAVNYYQSVVSTLGKDQTDGFVRFYMVPGMQHCGGGPGPNLFGQVGVFKPGDSEHDIFTALDEWVEKGAAPGNIIATKYKDGAVEMTRPLCRYPELAKYDGTGDANKASSFTCASPGQ